MTKPRRWLQLDAPSERGKTFTQILASGIKHTGERRQLAEAEWLDVEVPALAALSVSPQTRAHPTRMGLGTPMQTEHERAARREKMYARLFRVLVWIALIGGAYIAGMQRPRADAAAQAPAHAGDDYRRQAKLPAAGKRNCKLDPHEDCLVCVAQE